MCAVKGNTYNVQKVSQKVSEFHCAQRKHINMYARQLESGTGCSINIHLHIYNIYIYISCIQKIPTALTLHNYIQVRQMYIMISRASIDTHILSGLLPLII